MKWWFCFLLKVGLARGRRSRKSDGVELEVEKQNVGASHQVVAEQNVGALYQAVVEQNVVASY